MRKGRFLRGKMVVFAGPKRASQAIVLVGKRVALAPDRQVFVLSI